MNFGSRFIIIYTVRTNYIEQNINLLFGLDKVLK